MKKIQHQYFRLVAYTKKEPKKSIVFGIIILIVLFLVYRYFSPATTATQYIYGTVKKGTVESVVTGSGQVSGLGQIDLKAKASGDIVAVNVVPGQEVKTGDVLASVDARDALINLQSAEIAYQKLTKPADAITLIQAQNALQDAKQNQTEAEATLIKSYDDGFSAVSDSFLDAPKILTGLFDLLSSKGYLSSERVSNSSETIRAYQSDTEKSYYDAKNAFDVNFIKYKSLSRGSATTSIESLMTSTHGSMQTLAGALKDAQTAVDYIRNNSQNGSDNTLADTARTNISTWTGETNGHLNAILSAINTRENAKSTLATAAGLIQEKTESFLKTQNGADPLDVQSEALSLQQKRNAYNDSFIRAPFDGVVARFDIKKTDAVSSGTVVGVLVTKQKVAAISLNEVDAAKIKIGQKVSLTFDAIDNLTIDGTVSEVDLVGTVSQGVVTYGVKIAFNTQDDRIRSGMSVNATIVTESKENVLVVPNAAIKTQAKKSYVEVPGTTSTTVQKVFVETGLVGDTTTEITSGLVEGDKIVIRSITTTAKTTAAPTATSLLGGGRGAGGTTRSTGGSATR